MKIEGQRIGALDAAQPGRKVGSQHGQCAISAVNVKPQVFATRKIGEAGKVVDRARVHGPGGARQPEKDGSRLRGLS